MSISLTVVAADRVKGYLFDQPAKKGLRFGVKNSGCSGFAYVMDFADTVESTDSVFESHGVNIIVDKKSLPTIDGTEIDFKCEGLDATFRFNNPNVSGSCGCGESFSVENRFKAF